MLPILLENEAMKKIQTGLDYDPTEIEIALRDTFISVDTELHKLMKNYRRFAGKIYDCDSQSETELEALTWNPVRFEPHLVVENIPSTMNLKNGYQFGNIID